VTNWAFGTPQPDERRRQQTQERRLGAKYKGTYRFFVVTSFISLVKSAGRCEDKKRKE